MEKKLIGVKEIMELTGVGRSTVIAWLNDSTCPVLKREKGCKYLITEEDFFKWLKTQSRRK